MKLFSHSFRSVRLQITCADIPSLLHKMSMNNVIIFHLTQNTPLSIMVELDWKQLRKMFRLAKSYGADIKILSHFGLFWVFRTVYKRPICLYLCIVIILLTLYLPGRILIIEVEGNTSIETNRILESAAVAGICFGTNTESVRSESVKNVLLCEVPELEWVGINTYGCRAVISLRERSAESNQTVDNEVSSIIAVCDGIVESCTATKGTLLCKPGQEVKKGDVLVSAYSDCGSLIRATKAEGEIYAQTQREISVIIPLNYKSKGEAIRRVTNISLCIGKKRINFFKDSGILGVSCVKMYQEYPFTLPGGFDLPVVLVLERCSYYELGEYLICQDSASATVARFAEDYLLGNIVSGKMLGSTSVTELTEELLIYHCTFSVVEMIGRVRNEGTIDIYGKDS